ncbi:hypothetical protein PF010_g27289 [Phytophthora fragariae]|nr:hypothetical protein PF003_g12430 [Phytophthora fragariae]KAE8973350.1 hypothetical protein PR002_g26227 [Phytophthora rubi]KAE8921034.1 hypothetical protein PF009_g28680 [Phytophthora fragariae]KAE9007239.1 hypothetical protein PR001_g17018 [Phytophthora rubi]KAE9067884.1 hypothetical protein PF010_g27289 [Phytophthora fragariae]
MAWWLALDKSDDSVKKALGMEGLTGPALKAHSNYKLLAKYADKAEKYHLRKMVQGGFPTYEIWAELGFSRITDTRQIEKIKHTSAYTTYKRYVNMFDDNILWTMGSGYYLPKFASENATPAEMTARAQIWAEAGRSDDYVRMILGLKGLDGARLIRNKNYSYYAEFLAKTQSLSH